MRDVVKKLLWSIPFTSASVSLFLAYSRWKANIAQEAQLGLYFITGFAIVAFVLLLAQEYRYGRKARYAETTSNLLNVVTLRERDLPATSGHCCEILNKMVGEVAETFTLLTGTRASACLKKVVMVGAAPHFRARVEDIARDSKSQLVRVGRYTRVAKGKSVSHWVDLNTDFNHLWENAGSVIGRFYFSNNLPIERDYRNTSFEVYGQPSRWTWPIFGATVRRINWPLPYTSALVVPVMSQTGHAARMEVVVGYLCVDSHARYVFDRRYDVPLLEMFAQLVSPFLNHYLDLIKTDNGKTETADSHHSSEQLEA